MLGFCVDQRILQGWDYGPPLYKTFEEVEAAYKALSQINMDTLAQANDPDKYEAADIDPDNYIKSNIYMLAIDKRWKAVYSKYNQ